MGELKGLFASVERLRCCSDEELAKLAARYPWFRPLRIEQLRRGEATSAVVELTAPWRMESSLLQEGADVDRLMHITTEDIINRFLREEELRIVADEGEVDEEVQIEASLSDEEELVSEELAEIYLAQGLREETKAIYRKLSLLNPEKSVYFAELIDHIENNN